MYAIKFGKLKTLETLCELGSDPELANFKGESPMKYAEQKNHKVMISVLKKAIS